MQAQDAGIEQVSAESAGVLDIAVIGPADAPDVFARAMRGDPECLLLFNCIETMCGQIDRASKESPMVCTTCQQPLEGSDHTFALAIPSRDDPKHFAGVVICGTCAAQTADAKALGVAALRTIWPRLRRLTITNPVGGHA